MVRPSDTQLASGRLARSAVGFTPAFVSGHLTRLAVGVTLAFVVWVIWTPVALADISGIAYEMPSRHPGSGGTSGSFVSPDHIDEHAREQLEGGHALEKPPVAHVEHAPSALKRSSAHRRKKHRSAKRKARGQASVGGHAALSVAGRHHGAHATAAAGHESAAKAEVLAQRAAAAKVAAAKAATVAAAAEAAAIAAKPAPPAPREILSDPHLAEVYVPIEEVDPYENLRAMDVTPMRIATYSISARGFHPSPLLAAGMSLLLPGSSDALEGNPLKSAIGFGTEAAGFGAMAAGSTTGNLGMWAFGVGLIVANHIISPVMAFSSAYEHDRREEAKLANYNK